MSLNFPISEVLKLCAEPAMVVSPQMQVIAVNNAAQNLIGLQQPSDSTADLKLDGVLNNGASTAGNGNPAPQLQFFKDRKPYNYIRNQQSFDGENIVVQAVGKPILDAEGQLYLFETMRVINQPNSSKTDNRKNIIGVSEACVKMRERIQKVAPTKLPVLLYGESGSGKEMAAQYVHQLSTRNAKPFVVGDCTVLSEALFESELFGHEKGSFTGSVGEKKGLIEVANGGTLFLDEIGELPLPLQAKLLRLLENFSYRRVGGTEFLTADVRIISATNRDLFEMVKEGTFRQDLYYRLTVFPILVPSLSERREDIPLLVEGLLEQIGKEMGRKLQVSAEAMKKLCSLSLVGNVRELRNILQYASAVCNDDIIAQEDLMIAGNGLYATEPDAGLSFRRAESPTAKSAPANAAAVSQNTDAEHANLPDDIVDRVEMQYLADLLKRYHGDKVKVAEHLGISQRTLYRRLAAIKQNFKDFVADESNE